MIPKNFPDCLQLPVLLAISATIAAYVAPSASAQLTDFESALENEQQALTLPKRGDRTQVNTEAVSNTIAEQSAANTLLQGQTLHLDSKMGTPIRDRKKRNNDGEEGKALLVVQSPLSPDTEPPSLAPLPEPDPPSVLPPADDLLESPVRPITPQPDSDLNPDNDQTKVVVQRFEIVGSTVFTDEELAEITAPFTNRPLSLDELLQVRSAITQIYVDKGYITSGAFVPPQSIDRGVVTIQIVEGQLDAIEVTGTKRLSPSYIRRRVAIAAKPPLNVDKLVDALQMLRSNPLIDTLSSELAASPSPGRSILNIQIEEADSFDVTARLDNGRSPSVGSLRRRVQLTEGNLFGQGDSVLLSYTNTDGSNALDLGYTWPINPRNGTISAAFGVTSSDVIEPPFDILEIESDSRYYELTYRQPILQTPNQELALGLTASRQESETELLDIPFPLSAGADEQGRTRVSALRFFQEWTTRSSTQAFALRSQFSLGLDAFGSTINEDIPGDFLPQPDSRFFSWRGQSQWVQRLARDTLFIMRGDLQFADRPLLAFEQFGLGGLERLRGYRQDFLLTDNAFFASAEFRLPIYRLPDDQGIIHIVPFLDFGTGWNNERPDPETNTLVSAGIGIRARLGDRFNARFEWGIPLITVDDSDRTWQENGLLFSIDFTLF